MSCHLAVCTIHTSSFLLIIPPPFVDKNRHGLFIPNHFHLPVFSPPSALPRPGQTYEVSRSSRQVYIYILYIPRTVLHSLPFSFRKGTEAALIAHVTERWGCSGRLT